MNVSESFGEGQVCNLSEIRKPVEPCTIVIFGASGDLTAVPPKAATIGPAEVIAAKHRIDLHAISVGGSFQSWQRLTTRLVLHGPVTPHVPESILQTLRTDVWVSESAAADIKPHWELGY